MNCSDENSHAIDNKNRRDHILYRLNISKEGGLVAVSVVMTLLNYVHH